MKYELKTDNVRFNVRVSVCACVRACVQMCMIGLSLSILWAMCLRRTCNDRLHVSFRLHVCQSLALPSAQWHHMTVIVSFGSRGLLSLPMHYDYVIIKKSRRNAKTHSCFISNGNSVIALSLVFHLFIIIALKIRLLDIFLDS